MCGIIYAKNLVDDGPVNNLVKALYQNQKDRGQQGFGFAGLNANRIDTYRAISEKGILNYLNEHQYSEIMFHHRFPTSTQNTLKSTHPFITKIGDKRYYFVHNGIIQNADDLKEKHAKQGITYLSEQGADFNDSEALAWDFCLWLSNKQRKMAALGSVALVCLEVEKRTNRAKKLYFYRNNKVPLKIYKDKTLFLLTSAGNYTSIKRNWLYFWDYQTRQIRRYKLLKVECPATVSFYMYNRYPIDSEVEAEAIIQSLEQDLNRALTVGDYVRAEEIEDEIADLKVRLEWAKRRNHRTGHLDIF